MKSHAYFVILAAFDVVSPIWSISITYAYFEKPQLIKKKCAVRIDCKLSAYHAEVVLQHTATAPH